MLARAGMVGETKSSKVDFSNGQTEPRLTRLCGSALLRSWSIRPAAVSLGGFVHVSHSFSGGEKEETAGFPSTHDLTGKASNVGIDWHCCWPLAITAATAPLETIWHSQGTRPSTLL